MDGTGVVDIHQILVSRGVQQTTLQHVQLPYSISSEERGLWQLTVTAGLLRQYVWVKAGAMEQTNRDFTDPCDLPTLGFVLGEPISAIRFPNVTSQLPIMAIWLNPHLISAWGNEADALEAYR